MSHPIFRIRRQAAHNRRGPCSSGASHFPFFSRYALVLLDQRPSGGSRRECTQHHIPRTPCDGTNAAYQLDWRTTPQPSAGLHLHILASCTLPDNTSNPHASSSFLVHAGLDRESLYYTGARNAPLVRGGGHAKPLANSSGHEVVSEGAVFQILMTCLPTSLAAIRPCSLLF